MLHQYRVSGVHQTEWNSPYSYSSIYHPASNGQAERAVKIVKEGLKKASKGSLEMQISKFLFHYRLTPHTITGVAPAELLLGRRPPSHLDLVKPDLRQQVQSKQMVQLTKSGGRILKLEVMSLPRILDQENIGLQEPLSVHVAQSPTRLS